MKCVFRTGRGWISGRATLVPLLALLATAPALALSIDFETDGMGNPLVNFDSIASSEYAAQGLATIVDSDTSQGSSFLNPTHPLNVGTAISGEYVNVGAFAAIPDTFIDLKFAAGSEARVVSFDWATGGTGAAFVEVSLFGLGDLPLGTLFVHSTTTFVNNAGSAVPAGSFFVDLGGVPIARVRIEDEPGAIRGLILDNLRTVPEPGIVLLLGSGLVLLAASRSGAERRRSARAARASDAAI